MSSADLFERFAMSFFLSRTAEIALLLVFP